MLLVMEPIEPIFYVALIVVPLLGLFFGVLVFVSPPAFLRFGVWWGKKLRLNPPEIQWKGDFYWSWRLAGLIIAAFSGFAASKAISLLRNPSARRRIEAVQPPMLATGPNWFGIGSGLLMFLAGLALLVRPQILARWRSRWMPYLTFGQEAPGMENFLTRMFGVLWMVGGAAAILFSLGLAGK